MGSDLNYSDSFLNQEINIPTRYSLLAESHPTLSKRKLFLRPSHAFPFPDSSKYPQSKERNKDGNWSFMSE